MKMPVRVNATPPRPKSTPSGHITIVAVIASPTIARANPTITAATRRRLVIRTAATANGVLAPRPGKPRECAHRRTHVRAGALTRGSMPRSAARHQVCLSVRRVRKERTMKTVVAVTQHPQRVEVWDALLDDENYDAVFVESVARGYARIKQRMPDLIMLFADPDDAPMCRLLTMLKLDREVAHIPVVTCISTGQTGEFEDMVTGLTPGVSSVSGGVWTSH